MLRNRHLVNSAVILAITTTCSLCPIGCGGDKPAQAAATGGLSSNKAVSSDVVIMPDADLLFKADLKAVRETPVYIILAQMGEAQKLAQTNSDMKKLQNVSAKLSEITGLTKEDITGIKMAARLDNIDFNSSTEPDFQTLEIAFAAALSKPLPLSKLEQAIREAAKDDQDSAIIKRSTLAGNDVIMISDSADGKESLVVTVIGNQQLLVAGSENGVRGVLERAAKGSASAPIKFDQAAIDSVGASQITLFFAPTDGLRDKLRQDAADKQTAKPGSVEANFAQAMRDLKGLAIGINMKETMAVSVNTVLGSDDDAAQLKSIFDGTVIGMAQFMLTMMAGGKPVPLLQSLRTATTPGGLVTLSFAISVADINLLQEAAARQTESAAAPMPAPAPPPPPPPAPPGN